jgi:hypothetical protein
MKLEETKKAVMLNIMNAAEIIREIARLPDTEQGKIVEFVEALKSTKQVRYIDSAVVEKTAEKVFREHAPLFEKLAQ